MRLHRFYIEENITNKSEFTIRDEAVLHQMRDVFRLSKGDRVIFFDGSGIDTTCLVEVMAKKEGVFVKEKTEKSIEVTKQVTLYMSLIKKDLFELVLEKCTEIGVTHFVPVITERTQNKNLNIERAGKIVREASEQCGRGDVPTIGEAVGIEEVLKENADVIILDMEGEPLNDYGLQNNDYKLLIGPEGGWSDKELERFKDLKIKTFKLGDTILRAETAAIVASAMMSM